MPKSPDTTTSTASAPAGGAHLRPLATLLVLALVGAGAALFLNLPKPGQPEKVWENFPHPEPVPLADPAGDTTRTAWRVQGGKVFKLVSDGPTLTVVSRPVRGGAVDTLYHGTVVENARVTLDSTAAVGDDLWVYLTVLPNPTPTRTGIGKTLTLTGGGGTGGAGRPGLTEEFLTFRLPDAPLAPRPGDTLRTVKTPATALPRWQAVRVAPDGAGQVVRIGLEGTSGKRISRRSVGDAVFWCESSEPESTEYTTTRAEANAKTRLHATLLRPTTELFMRPLAAGPVRRLAGELTPPADSEFLTLEDGVALVQPRPFPDKGRDLLVFRAPDYRAVRVAGFAGADPPVVAQGRIWWVEQGKIGVESSQSRSYLVSVAADGADPRRALLTSNVRNHTIRNPLLSSCRGRLFLSYQTEIFGGRGEYYSANYDVAVLSAGAEPLVRPFLHFPYRFGKIGPDQVDGDYLYFIRDEERADPFDAFFERNTARPVSSLYRIAIPH